MASQALASLTATYTDSEGEEDMEEAQITPEKGSSPLVTPLVASLPASPKPQQKQQSESMSAPVTPKPPKRLVSYNDDTVVSDEEEPGNRGVEEDDEHHEEVPMDLEDNEPVKKPAIVAEDGITIPPEPPGKCSAELQEKIASLYYKMQQEGRDMNKTIQDKKNFRNPSIYEKLIQFCNINELDTNYPPEIYDPLRWGKESFYEELAKAQKVEMDRREKDRKEKLSKINFQTGFVKKDDDDPKKRKSKWDQVALTPSAVKLPVKPAGLLQPALTTTATGTKGTVISAFGSLPKKAKV